MATVIEGLTVDEIRRLQVVKYRYAVMSRGFTKEEANRLFYWRWRVETGRQIVWNGRNVARKDS